MKKSLRLLSCLLAITLLVGTATGLTACTTPNDPSGTESSAMDSTGSQGESEADSEAAVDPEKARLNAKDNLPDDLDYKEAVITLLTRTGDEDTNTEFLADKATSDIVSSAVYERNVLVEERLNIELEIVESSDSRHSGKDINQKLAVAVPSGTDDYDVVCNHMNQSPTAVLAGYLKDLNQYDYIDFDQPWWNSSYAEVATVDGRLYLAAGELALTYLSGAYAMYYNKPLWEETHGANELYEMVNRGEWTLDQLIKLTADTNVDMDGDGKLTGDRDICGLFYMDEPTLMADALVGGAGIRFTEVADGTYDYILNNERTMQFVDKIKLLLFENDGTIQGNCYFATALKKLSMNTALFTINMLNGTTYLRDMEDDYGIVPLPKLDMNQESYKGFVHDGFSVVGIPSTVDEKGEMVSAFIEATCSESYRRVTYAYYDTALKVQYARDPIAAGMLDTICESIAFDFAYVYDGVLDYSISCFRTLFNDSVSIGKAASTFRSIERSTEKKMGQLVEKLGKLES